MEQEKIYACEPESLNHDEQMIPSTSQEKCASPVLIVKFEDVDNNTHKTEQSCEETYGSHQIIPEIKDDEEKVDKQSCDYHHQMGLEIMGVQSVKLELQEESCMKEEDMTGDMTDDPDSPKHVCGYCGLMYCLQEDYLHHLNVQHGCDITQVKLELKDNDTLPDVGKETESKAIEDKCKYLSNAKLNMENYKRENLYKCGICDQAFAKTGHLKNHLKTHKKRHKCDVCGKAFIEAGTLALEIHMKTCTEKRQLKCDICGKAFTEVSKLNKHIRIHNKSHECEVCGKTFTQIFNLTKHFRTHTGEKPYKCGVCGMTFAQNGCLTRHIRIHTEQKPYKCDVCGKAFTQASGLQSHTRTHTGEKAYKCNVCEKTFKEANHLRKHIRTHTGEKPYKCDVCGKTFSDTCDLKKHKRIHTGEKPYKCDMCEKAFNQSSSLKGHKFRKHTNK